MVFAILPKYLHHNTVTEKKELFQKNIILPLYFIVDNLILNLMYTDKRESGLQHNKEQIGTHIASPTQRRKKDRE